jgi:phosphoglycolate phosphatase-like HAD superfamily hydrolase
MTVAGTVSGRRARWHVLFDLDGTLTDSLPGISRCINHALGDPSAGADFLADTPMALTEWIRGAAGRTRQRSR